MYVDVLKTYLLNVQPIEIMLIFVVELKHKHNGKG